MASRDRDSFNNLTQLDTFGTIIAFTENIPKMFSGIFTCLSYPAFVLQQEDDYENGGTRAI